MVQDNQLIGRENPDTDDLDPNPFVDVARERFWRLENSQLLAIIAEEDGRTPRAIAASQVLKTREAAAKFFPPTQPK